QNKDPQTQGVLEAASNSIDAIFSERKKIGQFGLGVKQFFELLQKGEGEVSTVTLDTNGEMFALRAKRGYDGEIYIKFSSPTPEERSKFEENTTGTLLSISGITINPDKRTDIISKVEQRFRYVPEINIVVNGKKINGCEKIKVVGRTEPVTTKGDIEITIDEDNIVIKDTGAGMNQEGLFRMFLPGHGKGYNPLSHSEAQKIAQEQAEVLFIPEDKPRIVFSRNHEANFSVEIPPDRTHTASETICL